MEIEKKMKSKKRAFISGLIKLVIVFTVLVIGGMTFLYFNQEFLIFHAKPLDSSFSFQFDQPFREVEVNTKDGEVLHGLHFSSDSSKGVVFYLHGNMNGMDKWGLIAPTYLDHNYDILMFDYRGFGKSTGNIESEAQFVNDAQIVYNYLKTKYDENKIVVIGYSIGTYVATQIAASNQPKTLVLQSPYFNLTDLMTTIYPVLPTGLLRYKFKTNEAIVKVKCAVNIFHGTEDSLIPFNSAERLQELDPQNITVYPLKHQPHGGMNYNKDYYSILPSVLN